MPKKSQSKSVISTQGEILSIKASRNEQPILVTGSSIPKGKSRSRKVGREEENAYSRSKYAKRITPNRPRENTFASGKYRIRNLVRKAIKSSAEAGSPKKSGELKQCHVEALWQSDAPRSTSSFTSQRSSLVLGHVGYTLPATSIPLLSYVLGAKLSYGLGASPLAGCAPTYGGLFVFLPRLVLLMRSVKARILPATLFSLTLLPRR